MRRAVLFLLVIGLMPVQPPAHAGGADAIRMRDRREAPEAVVVTEDNLLGSERFWPYRVKLVRDWGPTDGGRLLRSGLVGVLIRVESSGLARIDFGRDGLYALPVDATDVVERANRVRLGRIEKMAPNFVVAIGPRLVDSGAPALRPLGTAAAARGRGYLCVFADPGSEGFEGLAAALKPVQERHGVMTLLFPQGEPSDAEVRERLRELDWTVPFVYSHLVESYTRSLLDEDAPLPALVLQTREGRVLFETAWDGSSRPSQLESVLDAAFGDAAVVASEAR